MGGRLIREENEEGLRPPQESGLMTNQMDTIEYEHRRAEPRRPLSASVIFSLGSMAVRGWTLNESDHGLRALIEDGLLPVGAVIDVSVDKPEGAFRRAMRVVWIHESQGGSVLGLTSAN